MPTTSQVLQLFLYNNTDDKEQLFIDFRDNLAGPGSNSNMQKIDGFAGRTNDRLTILENLPHTITVKAIKDADNENNFIATIDGFTSYKTNLIMIIYLPENSAGLTTIKINNTDTTSLMKIGIDGTPVNLEANDLKANVGYLFQYDGTQLIALGEIYSEVIYSATQPQNQFTGGIWLKQMAGGTSSIMIKQANGTYLEVPPSTKASIVTFADNTTVEAFKTTVLNRLTQVEQKAQTNTTNIQSNLDKINILSESVTTANNSISSLNSSLSSLNSSLTAVSNNVTLIENCMQNPNLLDNTNFCHLVNQRGKTVYNTGGYTIDRWTIQQNMELTVLPTSNHIVLKKTANEQKNQNFTQIVEFKNSSCSTSITASCIVKGKFQMVFGFITIDGSFHWVKQTNIIDTSNRMELHSITYTLPNNVQIIRLGYVIKAFYGSDLLVYGTKLEIGTKQTLGITNPSNNGLLQFKELRTYQEELIKCQYYFKTINMNVPAFVNESMIGYRLILLTDIAKNMRIIPVYTAGIGFVINAGLFINGNKITFGSGSDSASSLKLDTSGNFISEVSIYVPPRPNPFENYKDMTGTYIGLSGNLSADL